MALFKIIIFCTVFVACAVATQIGEVVSTKDTETPFGVVTEKVKEEQARIKKSSNTIPTYLQSNVLPQRSEVAQPLGLLPENTNDEHARNKKFAIYSSYAYHSYPTAYIPPAIPAVSSYAYTYQKTIPYAYNAVYYPTAYAYPAGYQFIY